MSRYERRVRLPNLQTALAYRVIFRIPVDDLFAGIFEKVDQNIVKRARLLAQKLNQCAPTPLTIRKLARLAAIVSGPTTEHPSSE